MRRSTRGALGFLTAAAVAGTAVIGLLRVQSARLRAAYDLDARRRVPPVSRLVDPHLDHSVPLDSARAVTDVDPQETPAVAVLGDTWLAGLSVGRRRKTPGVLIARGLSTALGSPIRLTALAQPSARAEEVAAQVDTLLTDPAMRYARARVRSPRYAVVSMGSADVVHPVTGSIGIPVLTNALNRLEREGGYRVIVLTCPNLGRLPGVPRPLRTFLRRSSRVLAGSQWLTAVTCGQIPLSADEAIHGTTRPGPVSRTGRYPSPLGYQHLASAVLRRIVEDLDLPVVTTPTDRTDRKDPAP
ncbi:SGNH/GDSL hydrolase family protein [Brevibacterium litoralis]|uniref:SGNH/GDSL hydrolase family protein n=1 Tax=Brevibacterium litoralis TaxID=3138935 RepID=UPI0032F079DE